MHSKNIHSFTEWTRKILEQKFNVIRYYNILNYDSDWPEFEKDILSTRKDQYEEQDRYIIGHPDTDYYLPHVPYGLSVYNLIRSLLHCDIPLSKVIIISPHDISKEVKLCIPELCLDQPTFVVGCTYFDAMYRKSFPCDVDISSIDTHMCMMIGEPRIHRNIVYKYVIDHDLKNRMIISYGGSKFRKTLI